MTLYSPRIKTYNFGILTSNAGGVLVGSSAHPIVGEVLKIQLDSHNFATAGSLYLQTTSPITENLGSTITAQTDQTVYLSQSLGAGNYPVINDILTISGGGLGNTTSGAVVVYYR